MTVTQIYEIINDTTKEILGESAIVNEDLSNVVDIGTSVFNTESVDHYVRSLIDHIGKVIFVNRTYAPAVPSVLMDGWEYGAVMEKIRAGMPEATENESWELEDGASYDPNIFYRPDVSAKFYDKRVTFEIPMSFVQDQIKSAFSSAGQVNAFFSMIETAINKAMAAKTDAVIMRTINNMIGETFYSEVPGGTYTGRTGLKCVNLLYEYNTAFSKSLSVSAAFTDPDFIRYASYRMLIYGDRMKRLSKLFNIGGTDKFTPHDLLHFVLLADFARAADVYLQSDTFHNEFTRLPKAETVPFWQGSGTGYGVTDITKINVKTGGGHSIEAGGIIGVMFDRDALGVSNVDRRVTSNYNAKAEFYNYFHKYTCGSFNDLDENFVVFYLATT